jgi:hypothetical protein
MKLNTTLMRKILTKRKFQQFLLSYNPRSLVGYNGMPCKCPIAKYLKKTLESTHPHHFYIYTYPDEILVGYSHKKLEKYSDYYDDHEYFATDTWVENFIQNLDNLSSLYEAKRITAKKALEVLKSC